MTELDIAIKQDISASNNASWSLHSLSVSSSYHLRLPWPVPAIVESILRWEYMFVKNLLGTGIA
jgi:hypothetical protein